MRKQLVIVDSLHPEALEILARNADQLDSTVVAASELSSRISSAHFLITRASGPVDEQLLAKAPHLRLIVMAGVGTDHIDMQEASRRGIFIMNCQEANSTSTAEFTVGLILSLMRKIVQADCVVRSAGWTKAENHTIKKTLRGIELAGKTLGIVGWGRVGSRVGMRMKAFEMNVIAADPYKSQGEVEVPLVSYEELLKQSHLISFHAPLNRETYGMMNAQSLKSASRLLAVINSARGGIVVEKDIVNALNQRSLLGYAADVFETEPLPQADELRTHSQALLTPHIGAQTEEAQRAVGIMSVQKVLHFMLHGETSAALNQPKRNLG
jgi:D-3-phosphoglycerate dehydrogenase